MVMIRIHTHNIVLTCKKVIGSGSCFFLLIFIVMQALGSNPNIQLSDLSQSQFHHMWITAARVVKSSWML